MPLPNFNSAKNRTVNKGSFCKQQIAHVQKAVTTKECPPKKKHIRAIILATFDEHSSFFFFEIGWRLPVFSNPFVCWKFLHVVHKIIRDGHNESIKDVIRQVSKLSQLMGAWSDSVKECGYPINSLCQMILRRLRLHGKYGILPGSMELTSKELAIALTAPADHLFQFSVDLMDMLEETLMFQNLVLTLLEQSRSTAFTLPWQCKLVPLLPCVQDTAAIYELLVQIIYKLHQLLGHSTASGHRERFSELHCSVKKLFDHVSRMQYFRTLANIPALSSKPPNFCSQSGLDNHEILRITVHESDKEDNEAPNSADEELSDIPVLPITSIEVPAQKQTSTDVQYRDEKNGLQMNWVTFMESAKQFNNGSHSAVSDEKLEVLIEVELLKSEIERLKSEHHAHSQSLHGRIRTLEDEIKELVQFKTNHEEVQGDLKIQLQERTQQFRIIEEKFQKLKDVYIKLRDEHVNLLRNYSKIQQTIQSTNLDMIKMTEQVQNKQNLNGYQIDTLVSESSCYNGLSSSTNRIGLMFDELKLLIENEFEQCQTSENESSMESTNNSIQTQPNIYQSQFIMSIFNYLTANYREIFVENLLQNNNAFLEPINRLILLSACNQARDVLDSHLTFLSEKELFLTLHNVYSEYLYMLTDQCLRYLNALEHGAKANSSKDFYELPLTVNKFVSYLSELLFHLKVTAQSAKNLDQTCDFLEQFEQLRDNTINLLNQLPLKFLTNTSPNEIESLQKVLKNVSDYLCNYGQFVGFNTDDADISEDIIQKEMEAAMDAINKAEMKFQDLVKQSQCTNAKQEIRVNAAIFDYCSALMSAIRKLIQKSQFLQKEILGTDIPKEFYKRHHRWTDGFLSAAKFVGAGANVIVDFADSLLSGNGTKLEHLIVMSQEISASTTQLVCASRVKANPKSENLVGLHNASKEVTEATGNLIGCVKSRINARNAEELDFSGLTLTKAKRMEVDSQIKILELEAELENERRRFAQLRKTNYQGSAEVEYTRR